MDMTQNDMNINSDDFNLADESNTLKDDTK